MLDRTEIVHSMADDLGTFVDIHRSMIDAYMKAVEEKDAAAVLQACTPNAKIHDSDGNLAYLDKVTVI